MSRLCNRDRWTGYSDSAQDSYFLFIAYATRKFEENEFMKITLQLDEDQPLLEMTDAQLEGYDCIILKLGDHEAIVNIHELTTAVEALNSYQAGRERANKNML